MKTITSDPEILQRPLEERLALMSEPYSKSKTGKIISSILAIVVAYSVFFKYPDMIVEKYFADHNTATMATKSKMTIPKDPNGGFVGNNYYPPEYWQN